MYTFRQVCRYLDMFAKPWTLLTFKRKNGRVLNNSEYDRDFKGKGYFKTFKQLFYICPDCYNSRFAIINGDYDEVIIREL